MVPRLAFTLVVLALVVWSLLSGLPLAAVLVVVTAVVLRRAVERRVAAA